MIKPIKCEPIDNGKVMNFHDYRGTFLGIMYPDEVYLWSSINASEYVFDYANTTYAVSKIHFYDPEGRIYTNKQGYLHSASARYPGISFKTKQKHFSRLKITRDFKWSEAHQKDLLFFVSRGKMGYTKPQAELYIPFSYLVNLGFEIILETIDLDPRTFILQASLVTPKFVMVLSKEQRYSLLWF